MAIVSCWPKEANVQQQRKTWLVDLARYGIDYRIFYGAGAKREALSDEVFLDCADDYYGLPSKVRGIMRYSVEHGFQHTFKCDDDVLVNVTRLAGSGKLRQHDYIGGRVIPNLYPRDGLSYSAGYTYCLSQRAARLVAEADTKGHRLEDVWVGKVLSVHGINPVEDLAFSERVYPKVTQFQIDAAISVVDHRGGAPRGKVVNIDLPALKTLLQW